MNTTFIIDGGAGRLITAIPALEKYAINNPNDDFRILTAAWESLYWAHPVLQNRAFNINQKGVFDLHMKDRRVVHPEPYQVNGYYNQKKHLIECFDQIINNTDDHSDLDKPNLYITTQENLAAQSLIADAKQKKVKRKFWFFLLHLLLIVWKLFMRLVLNIMNYFSTMEVNLLHLFQV
jgi:hypothetical protein